MSSSIAHSVTWKINVELMSCKCLSSPCSKRFRVVSEQRKSEERRRTGFSVLMERKMFFAEKSPGNA